MSKLTAILILVSATSALAGEQTRVYGPDGRSLGTTVPQGQGTVRFYDARGNVTGTATTTGNTTKFYDPRGNVTGSTTGPGPFQNKR